MDEKTLNAYCAMIAIVADSVYSRMLNDAYRKRYPGLPYSEDIAATTFTLDQLVYYDLACSDFQWLAEVLTPLNILTNVQDPDGTCNPYLHRFLCPPAEASHFARLHWRQGVPFEEVLWGFLEHYSCYGTEWFGLVFRMNAVFHPRNGMEKVIRALARLRYAQPCQDGYRWTKRVRPAVAAAVAVESHSIIRKAHMLSAASMGDQGLFPRPHEPEDE